LTFCSPRSRHNLHARQPKSHILEDLLTNATDIVCVVGEANAWPCRDTKHRSAYPDELVQWVALRPSTGERFACFAAPRNPLLSPSTPAHLSVEADTLHAGGSLEALLESWQTFVREDDVICSWGRYAGSPVSQ